MRNRLSPMKSKLNSAKKTKVQFSTRLSSCLGEHQSQEFFERLNITRQSGICSKNKNNSFGENKSHSFRQTLQLNIPFIADLSDFKELCICYPVHFFRRKLQSYDSEDSRLASVRVYYPASRMKYGNEFKVSMDLKKRYHLQPHQYEFVAYSNLLTLSLEDLALAVFRAKSLSEKFKIVHSLPIPKILLSANNITSQIGTPIFIGTERIYSRLSKLIACSQNGSFQLNNSNTNSDSHLYFKKCILKWVGLCDFLPLSSRLVFVRRVSGDSGDTLGVSILNSPGPKIRRSRIKEGDRFSIRLKQTKFDCLENEIKSKLLIEPIAYRVKSINSRCPNNKRPRGRPKKLSNGHDKITPEFSGDKNNNELVEKSKDVVEEKVKIESLHLKTESVSNSLVDSTSEEKYSVQLSTCSTPDTIKSRSPIALNGALSTTINSTAPISQVAISTNENSIITKNKRGRPRKYPSNIQEDSNIKLTLSKNKSGNFEVLSKSQDEIEVEEITKFRKRSNSNSCSSEPNSKICKLSNDDLSLLNDDASKEQITNQESCNQSVTPVVTCYNNINNNNNNNQCLYIPIHSMWNPLKYPLSAPDPIVPFIKLISSTGINRNTQINSKTNYSKTNKSVCNDNDSINSSIDQNSGKVESTYQPFLKETKYKTESNYAQNSNLLLPIPSKNNSKKNVFSDEIDIFGSNQCLLQNNIFNQLLLPPNTSSLTHNNLNVLSPYFNNILNPHNSTLNNLSSPVTVNLTTMFPLTNSSNSVQLPFSFPSQLLYDPSGNLLLSSNNSQMSYTSNTAIAGGSSLNHQTNFQHQPFNHILLANRHETINPALLWNNGLQWKY